MYSLLQRLSEVDDIQLLLSLVQVSPYRWDLLLRETSRIRFGIGKDSLFNLIVAVAAVHVRGSR